MAEEKKKKLQVSDICLQSVVKEQQQAAPTTSSSTPSSPRRMRDVSIIKYSCLCSPTTHPGSFRCRHHRNHMRTSMSVGSKLSEMAAGK